jgi:hypothetical protein
MRTPQRRLFSFPYVFWRCSGDAGFAHCGLQESYSTVCDARLPLHLFSACNPTKFWPHCRLWTGPSLLGIRIPCTPCLKPGRNAIKRKAPARNYPGVAGAAYREMVVRWQGSSASQPQPLRRLGLCAMTPCSSFCAHRHHVMGHETWLSCVHLYGFH